MTALIENMNECLMPLMMDQTIKYNEIKTYLDKHYQRTQPDMIMSSIPVTNWKAATFYETPVFIIQLTRLGKTNYQIEFNHKDFAGTLSHHIVNAIQPRARSGLEILSSGPQNLVN